MAGSVCSNSACRAAVDQRKKSRWSRSRRCLACGAASRGDSFIKPSTSCLKCIKSPQRWAFDPQCFFCVFFWDIVRLCLSLPEMLPKDSSSLFFFFFFPPLTKRLQEFITEKQKQEVKPKGHFTASWPRQASHFYGWLECILEKNKKNKKVMMGCS